MAQTDPAPAFNQKLVERVIAYLQTRDAKLFPFTSAFDEEQERAFVRDLRVGLSDLTESGAKRGTSASGFLVSDRRLQEIVAEWAEAGGGWPGGTDPRDAFTSLSAVVREIRTATVPHSQAESENFTLQVRSAPNVAGSRGPTSE